MNKNKTISIGIIVILLITIASLIFNLNKNIKIEETEATLKENATNNKEEYLTEYKAISSDDRIFFHIISISQEDYERKRDLYYSEDKSNLSIKTELDKRIIVDDECYKFLDKNNKETDLILCDKEPEEGTLLGVKDFKQPVLIDEINEYLISEVHYESGKLYLLNYDRPNTLVLTYGYPVISPNSKYFYTLGNESGGYGDDQGLEIWKINKGFNQKIATLSKWFFNGNGPVGVFWADNEIYMNTHQTEVSGRSEYIKISFSEL